MASGTEHMNTDLITLTRHLIHLQRLVPGATGDFTLLMASIQLGCKYVSNAVRKAGLAKLTGLAGGSNTSGDEQKKLDVLADEVFINALESSGKVCLMVTEERENVIIVTKARGPYVVVFDPLDGSSNIDAGVSIGSIFGIYKVRDSDAEPTLADVLLPGKLMVAAGYCMYGSSTNLVLSFGNGVHGYTLDPSLGEFILTHENIQIPRKAKIYSINEGNSMFWLPQTTEFVNRCKNPADKKPKSARYIGSMVADVHRTLLYGGIFMYPGDVKSPKGKLRVLYECFPMAYLVEQAGGKASTGTHRILDIVPTSIHERAPIYLGSYDDVAEVESLASLNNA